MRCLLIWWAELNRVTESWKKSKRKIKFPMPLPNEGPGAVSVVDLNKRAFWTERKWGREEKEAERSLAQLSRMVKIASRNNKESRATGHLMSLQNLQQEFPGSYQIQKDYTKDFLLWFQGQNMKETKWHPVPSLCLLAGYFQKRSKTIC